MILKGVIASYLLSRKPVDANMKKWIGSCILDNEFRQFSWPIKGPKPGEDNKLISYGKTLVDQ